MRDETKRRIIRQLSLSVLHGDHSFEGIQRSVSWCVGLDNNFVKLLAREIVEAQIFTRPHSDHLQFLENTLYESKMFKAYTKQHHLKVVRWVIDDPNESESKAAMSFNVPRIDDLEQLAAFLSVSEDDLIWFESRFKSKNKSDKQNHYYYKTLKKANGSSRLLEIPKPRLKEIQRKIYSEILSKIPVHDCAHAFVKQRSVKSFVDFHIAKNLVLAFDLSNFYYSITYRGVVRIFKELGYSKEVSASLARCCLHKTPEKILQGFSDKEKLLLRVAHLPHGAPTSPSIANLVALGLDRRLNGLAKKYGFEYTRYADDLAFSNYESIPVGSFGKYVEKIVADEGFSLNMEKSRVYGKAQRQTLCGVVLNEKLSLPRKLIKLLEAELYNCLRHGAASQNRSSVPNYRSHLQGRISYVAQCAPHKVEKLWSLFDQINW